MAQRAVITFIAIVGVLLQCLVRSTTETCDFEKGMCNGYESDCSKRACFKVQRVDKMDFGPALDHNPGRGDGSCVYATGRGFAQLRRSFKAPFCFTGWYHVSGVRLPYVAFQTNQDPSPYRVFHEVPLTFAGSWHRVVYPETRSGQVNVTISTYLEIENGSASVALDDLTFQPGPCPPAPSHGSCDFDWGDACGYNVGNKSGQWELNYWTRIRRRQIIHWDVTMGHGGGYALYMPPGKGTFKGLLSSPSLEGRTRRQCLTFFYYIPKLNSRTTSHGLEVFTRGPAGTRKSVWKLSNDALVHGYWSPAQLSFTETSQFQLEFECSIESQSNKGIYCAVDYVRLKDCTSESGNGKLDCDFEEGLCSWLNLGSEYLGKTTWTLGGGSTKTGLPTPSTDHTLQKRNQGSYLFISSSGQIKGSKAHIVSEAILSGTKATDCMEFWYIVAGHEKTKLRLLSSALTSDIFEERGRTLLWEAGRGQFDKWVHGRIAVSDKTRVIFEAVIGPASPPGYVALDDIRVYANESCKTLPEPVPADLELNQLLDCSFHDQSLCNWEFRPRVSSVSWLFGTRSSPRTNIGPTALPAGTKGTFIFASEATILENRGALILTSPAVPRQSQPICATFRYHMFGALGAYMSISLEKDISGDGSSDAIKEYTFVSHRGRASLDRWFVVRRTLDMNGHFNKIKMVFGSWSNRPAEMAFGPLEFASGPCQVDTDSQGWCDFEYDTCQWSLGEASSGWKLQDNTWSAFHSHVRSGPPDSHSFLELQKARATNDSAVTSPSFQGRPEQQCLKFWYRRDNVSLGRIVVELVPLDRSQRTVLWEQPPYPKFDWMLARVPVVYEKEFKVAFRANVAGPDSPGSSFGLDDLQLDPEPCSPLFECDFEEDLCGYVNDFEGVGLRWLVGTGRLSKRDPSLGVPPPPSPSTDTAGGPNAWKRFAYVDLTIPNSHDESASTVPTGWDTVRLVSPVFEVGNTEDILRISYFRSGPDIASLELKQVNYKDYSGVPDTLQTIDLPQGDGWQSIQLKLKPSKQSQVLVALTKGKGRKGIAAIGVISAARASTNTSPGETSFSCDFDNGTFCGWEPSVGDVPFQLNDPANKKPPFPRSDHTLQAYSGRFIYAAYNGPDIKKAKLRSPELPTDMRGQVCVSLWHTSLPGTKGFLGLNVAEKILHVIGRDSSTTAHHWAHGMVQLKLSEKTDGRFTVEATLASGLIAVDDLQVNPGRCQFRDKCTFEFGSPCMFYNDFSNTRVWYIGRGDKLGVHDHTLQDNNGHFLFVNTTLVDPVHPASKVFLGTRQPTPATCVTFWWKGIGYRSSLNVYAHHEKTVLRDPVLSIDTDPTPGRWNPRTVTISSRTRWQLVFEAVSSPFTGEPSGVMLDDIEFTNDKCPPEDFCTFENDLCVPWADMKSSSTRTSREWEVERAGSFNKLPRDHTLRSEDGYYLLFRGTGNTSDSAALMLRENRFRCAIFWFFISKSSAGCSIQAGETVIDTATKTWRRHVFDLDWYTENGVTIRAYSGTDTTSFVAIDDIFVDKRRCSELGQTVRDNFVCGTMPERTLPMDRVCDFVKDCSNGADEVDCGTCDFANTSCGWNLDGTGRKNSPSWQRRRVGEVEGSPRLNSLRTTNGYYMILVEEEQPDEEARKAVATSPVFRNTNHLCVFSFWFNYANNSISVDLYLGVKGYNIPIWSLRARQPKPRQGIWQREAILLGRYPGEVKLQFSGFGYPVNDGYFVIEEFGFVNCPRPYTGMSSCNGNFRCDNGACVLQYDVCNYVDNCGDGSDEVNCGDHNMGCNFDSSMCDWKLVAPSVNEPHVWSWQRARPENYLQLSPTRDHTTGLQEGRFLILSSRSAKVESEIAGPVLQANGTCGITFFYVLYNGAPSTLSLGIRHTINGPFQEIWYSKYPTPFFHFVEKFIPIDSQKPFQVFFKGTHEGTKDSAYIAIDDVSFSPDCRPYFGVLPVAPVKPVTPVPTEAPLCPGNQFMCVTSGQCIPRSQVCDFKQHCNDGSDEKDCGACDFSVDQCGLTTESPDARLTWNRTSAKEGAKSSPGDYGLPTVDSEKNSRGFYAALRLTNPDVPGKDANALLTPRLGQMAHSCTVSFYAFLAYPNGSLWFGVQRQITPKTRRRKRFVVLTSAENNRSWSKLTVKVGNWNPGARFYFMSDRKHSSIDAIEYRGCHPGRDSESYEEDLKVSCEFSHDDTCGWFPENMEDDLDWTLYGGGVVTRIWQPMADDVGHSGPYMFITNPGSKEARGHLVSKRLGASGPHGRCFSFWYSMRHPNSGTLNLLLRTADNSSELIWTRTGPQGRAWLRGYADTYSDTVGSFVLEAVLPGSTPAVIAVDHIDVAGGPCKSKAICDFENDNCGWTLHDWEINRGQSIPEPSVDHTTETGSGRYARLVQSNGRMVSPDLRIGASSRSCVKFWHYLSGKETEQLNVSRVTDFKNEEPIWSVLGNQVPQKRWLAGSVELLGHEGSLMAAFTGSTSGQPEAAVAVDDILVDVDGCSAGSCQFEKDFCNWRNFNSKTNAVQWYRNSGPTMSVGGPQVDHTLKTEKGHYLLLDAQDLARVRVGVLDSELLSHGPNACLRMFYQMDAGSAAKITIQFLDMSKLVVFRKTLQAPKKNDWTLFQQDVESLPSLYTVRVIGVPGMERKSDIAIDDIEIFSGKCSGEPAAPTKVPLPTTALPTTPSRMMPTPTETAPSSDSSTPEETSSESTTTSAEPWTPHALMCTQGQFDCRDNEHCVPLALLCDGVRDCPNGLDEKCGGRHQCPSSSAFCPSGFPSWCIGRDLLCNGKKDCSDGSDESLCGECPPSFCLNGGYCNIVTSARPTCTCPDNASGERCEQVAHSSGELQVQSAGSNGWAIAVPVVLVIVGVAIIGILYQRRRRALLSAPLFVNNPTFDGTSSQA